MNYRPLLTITGGILIFFIFLGLFLKLVGPIPFNVNNLNTNKTDSFSVSGSGEVDQSPDTVMVTLGVQTQGPTVKAAQDSLNTNINSVSAAIKKLGISETDIQTQNYSLNPNNDYTTNNQKINGYLASTNLQIKVRDISKVNSVIDTGTAAGANQVGGIIFTVADPTKLENQAREKAVTEAKTRAQAAAKAAGFRLGQIVNYTENFGDNGRPVPMAANTLVKSDTAPTQVQPGSTTVHVDVTLQYQIN